MFMLTASFSDRSASACHALAFTLISRLRASRTMNNQPSRPRIPREFEPWFEARKRYHLSHATVQMARELGMNPRTLGKLASVRDQPWKLPLPEFIAECYFKAHKRYEPEHVRTLEQAIADKAAKKALQKERKALRACEPKDDAADTP
jgi:hypothetical protein